jgi:hypothetical protein
MTSSLSAPKEASSRPICCGVSLIQGRNCLEPSPKTMVCQKGNGSTKSSPSLGIGCKSIGPSSVLLRERLPQNEPGTGLTNEKWTLPLLRELGFGVLPTSAGPELAGRTYAINRFLGPVPLHLVGCGLSLDRRAAGVRGAAAANPHGLVQEFLNRSPGSMWGIVANGLRFRILRDNQALSRQSFLDFDLEAMFGGELYSDFVLLWLIAHATRFTPRDGGRPETCWLEEWTKLAEQQGTRALGELRVGVEKALQILGEGFTGHPKNTALRDALRTGNLSLSDFHGQLLRVVYRLIFLVCSRRSHP